MADDATIEYLVYLNEDGTKPVVVKAAKVEPSGGERLNLWFYDKDRETVAVFRGVVGYKENV